MRHVTQQHEMIVTASNARIARQHGWRPSLALCAILAHSAEAFAEAKDEAAQHFARAMELIRAGQTSRGLEQFRRAYELVPHFAVLYNIGLAHTDLGQPVEAVRAFRRYLEQGEQNIAAARKRDVMSRIGVLESTICRLEIRANVDGASIRVDGNEIGQSPLRVPVLANPGVHTVSAVLAGHHVDIVSLTMTNGQSVSVVLTLTRDAAGVGVDHPTVPSASPLQTSSLSASGMLDFPPPAASTPVHQERYWELQRIMAVTAAGLGLVGFGVGAGFALHALAKEKYARSGCGYNQDPLQCSPDGLRYNREALDASGRAQVAFLVGGALTVTGVALWFTLASGKDPRNGIGVHASPALGAGTVGMRLRVSL